jgi:L-ribulokinase
MFAAVVAGIYPTVEDAMAAMGRGFDVEYYPDNQSNEVYAKRYRQYNDLGKFVAWQIGLQSTNSLPQADPILL